METRHTRSIVAAMAAAVISIASPSRATEGAPLSVIDWLSDSVTLPEAVPAPAVFPPATLPDDIAVLPLGTPVPDRAGLIAARDYGLPSGLWGRSSASDLARAITNLPEGDAAPPALRRFLRDLLVLRLDPPIDAMVDDSLYLARIDRLLAMGHLSAAQSLIDGAGVPEPRRFRRAFDIALLTSEETEACRVIEETPDISPTYPARIFCLARLGQWDVAALTLGNAEALGILTPEEDKLMLHFLDAELFENEPVPPAPRLPSPLIFRLYEAVGERLQTDQLPVAYAVADLNDTVGWKSRLRSAERLAATDALGYAALLRIYNERKPSASGGVWERVRSHQGLARALDAADTGRVAQYLSMAWAAASEAGYSAGFADWVAPKLADFDLNGSAGHLAFEIALLAGLPDIAERFSAQTREDRFLLALKNGQGGSVVGAGTLDRAVLRGLSALGPGATFQALIDDGRQGEALLRALEQLLDGAAGNPHATANSLALLRSLGLENLARQIAVELVLMEGAA